MATTAKLFLTGKTESNDQVTLSFGPDYTDGRNKEWAKYIPAFSLSMTVLPEVAEHFTQGRSYVMTLTEEEASDG
jgi:hypothetical protein